MLSKSILLVWLGVVAISAQAQRYVLSEGVITFFSEATLENIKAENKHTTSAFDVTTGEIAFAVPNNQFQFEKKLMQQHFNEKYMESEKYPRSTFSGKVEGFDASKTGKQQVRATGKMFIHGVTQSVEIPGVLEVSTQGVSMKSTFMIKLADYKIKIPQILWQNIAEQVEVTVDLVYKPR
ncbi:MAG: YceI family protein [Cyclobacteriaceae bacterium]|nr:MAG: YceI family protein [Cyclobacteriaceae bacterium]